MLFTYTKRDTNTYKKMALLFQYTPVFFSSFGTRAHMSSDQHNGAEIF